MFPSESAYTDATALTIRGRASGPNRITAVLVNGVPASSSDGFGSWTARVPIARGDNELVVSIEDELGRQDPASDVVSVRNHGMPLDRVFDMAFSKARQRLVLTDYGLGAIMSVDPSGRASSVLSDRTRGSGVPLDGNLYVAIDEAHDRALTTDSRAGRLLAVDLDSGDRTIVSESLSSPSFLDLGALSVNPEGTRAFALVSEITGGGIFTKTSISAVDLSTGRWSKVSEHAGTVGPFPHAETDIAYDGATDPVHPRLLVSDRDSRWIAAIDITTGSVELLSSPWDGGGEQLAWPLGVDLDAANHRLLTVDGSRSDFMFVSSKPRRDVLVGIDLLTGYRTTLAGTSMGTGAPLGSPWAISFDPAKETIYSATHRTGRVVATGSKTLDRSVIVSSDVGTGEHLEDPAGLVLEKGSNGATTVVTTDVLTRAVVEVDVRTGRRSEISGSARGTGPTVTFPHAVALAPARPGMRKGLVVYDPISRTLFLVDRATGDRSPLLGLEGDRVIAEGTFAFDGDQRVWMTRSAAELEAVNPFTGATVVVSAADDGNPNDFEFARTKVFDYGTNPSVARALVVCARSVVAVNLADGRRQVLSATGVGEGPPLEDARSGAVDASGRRLLVIDAGQSVVAVDLVTGARALVSGRLGSGATRGEGPDFRGATEVVVDETDGIAYVLEASRGAIFAVDLYSGDRVIVSR